MSYCKLHPTDIQKLKELFSLKENEDKLIKKVLKFAILGDFTKYTSTLEEAWRISIQGLTKSLLDTIEIYKHNIPELKVDDDYTKDPGAAFGIYEAKMHRSRGITVGIFLALTKYYRQSYIDLICEAGFHPEVTNFYHLYIERFYDRVEIGYTTEWSALSKDQLLSELQEKTRYMTNEKNKYLTIFESLSTPVILLDEEYKINNINHATVQIFEGIKSPGSHYYQKDFEKISIDWLDAIIEDLRKDSEKNKSFEKKIRTRAGMRFFEVKTQEMLDVSKKFTGITIILTDLTERIEFDNLRKRFVSTVSHELRTPISAISLSVNNLVNYKERLSDENKNKLLSMVSESTKVLSKMIEDLLILSRVDSNRISLNITPVDVKEIIESVLYQMEPKNKEKNIQIVKLFKSYDSTSSNSLDYSSIILQADSDRLSQILRILIDNAIKYSKDNSTIEISLDDNYSGPYSPNGKNGILISIIDHGIGIKDEDKFNIFQRFFRSTDVKDIQGTGLGLSIAKELIEFHEGSINYTSKFGEGTTFYVFFPKK